jgi:hypothetical protein
MEDGMDQDQLAGLIAALVEVAVKFSVNVVCECDASNDVLRNAALDVQLKGCGFYKTTPESNEFGVIHPKMQGDLLRQVVSREPL